jgi:hypothetical protein
MRSKQGFNDTPCRIKKSLLIGYDMMPLRGLRKTEKVLMSKGFIATKCRVVPDENSQLFGVAINGYVSMAAAEWSVMGTADRCFMSTCGWLADKALTQDIGIAMKMVWTTSIGQAWEPTDRRTIPTFTRRLLVATQELRRLRAMLVPVSIVEA